MIYKKLVIGLAAFVSMALSAAMSAAQQPSPMPVQELVEKAAQSSKSYVEAFKNLLSEEKKTFEIFDKKGVVKKRRTIESTFLVYQLSKDEGQVAEFRNVVAIDGKRLANSDERAKNFFETVVTSETSQKELDRIRDESTRHDEDFALSGLTLFQAISLTEPLRASFSFELRGTENIDGANAYLVSYEQVSPNPAITVNGDGAHNYDIEIDKNKADLNARIRGKLWIDSGTFNIRRESRERTIKPPGFDSAVVIADDTFEYAEGGFNILTPKRIIHLQYRVNIEDRTIRKDIKVIFDYGKFTRPDVDVRSSEIK